MKSLYLLPLTQVVLVLVNLTIPALVVLASVILWKRYRSWPCMLMFTGAIALFAATIPALAMHPLFPVFGRPDAEQLAHITMMLSILRKVAWLVFAIGLVGYAATQGATRGGQS